MHYLQIVGRGHGYGNIKVEGVVVAEVSMLNINWTQPLWDRYRYRSVKISRVSEVSLGVISSNRFFRRYPCGNFIEFLTGLVHRVANKATARFQHRITATPFPLDSRQWRHR